MPAALVVMFWIWTGASVALLIGRALRRSRAVPSSMQVAESVSRSLAHAAQANDRLATSPSGPPPAEAGATLLGSAAVSASGPPTLYGTWTAAPPAPAAPPTPVAPLPTVTREPAEALRHPRPRAEQPPPPPPGPPANQPAAPGEPLRPSSPPSDRGPVGSLAEALSGISMPCDLTPLTMSTHDIASLGSRLVVSTSTYPAPIVEAALRTEFARLGMAVGDLDGLLVASRGTTTVHAQFFTTGAMIKGSASDRFPTARPDSVVVEITLGT